MKKTYNNPEMQLKIFNRDNLITTSGVVKSAEEKAGEALKKAGASQIEVVDWYN